MVVHTAVCAKKLVVVASAVAIVRRTVPALEDAPYSIDQSFQQRLQVALVA